MYMYAHKQPSEAESFQKKKKKNLFTERRLLCVLLKTTHNSGMKGREQDRARFSLFATADFSANRKKKFAFSIWRARFAWRERSARQRRGRKERSWLGTETAALPSAKKSVFFSLAFLLTRESANDMRRKQIVNSRRPSRTASR